MATVILTRGVPASGKSTWARAWVAEKPEMRARVSRDDIRYSNYGIGFGPEVDEQTVTEIQDASIRAHLKMNRDVVVDNTNLGARYVKNIMQIAREFDADVELRDFPIDKEVAIARDAARDRSVGRAVIESYFRRYVNSDGSLRAAPEYEDVKPKMFPIYVPDTSLPQAFGFDLDGTLAHMTDRGPYDTSRYHTDSPDTAVRKVANSLKVFGFKILVLSGRSEDYREVCEKWLEDNDVMFDELIMRKSGDTRRDDIVKSELFDEFIAPKYNFIMQFDDRNRVVDGLRSKGIKVAQVQEGDF